MTISQSIILTLINSIWQSALLYLLFILCKPILASYRPLLKRNFLLILLLSQLLISCNNFFSFISDSSSFSITSYYSDFVRMSIQSGWVTNGLLSVYFSVLFLKIFQVMRYYMNMRSYFYGGIQKPDAELRLFVKENAVSFGIRRKVNIFISERVITPMTFGFLKPVILIPAAAAANMDACSLEMLIIHELAHIRNKDFLLNWVTVLTECIYFFNPFLTAISRQVKLEREKESDISVLDFKYNALWYAEALLKVATKGTLRNSVTLQLTGNQSQLKQRILFFTEPRNQQLKHSGIKGLVILPLMLSLGLAIFSPDGKTNFNVEPSVKLSKKISLTSLAGVTNLKEIEDGIQPNDKSGGKKSGKMERKATPLSLQVLDSVVSNEDAMHLIQENPELIAEAAGPEFILAADKEPELSREIILKEEISGGTITVYCYIAEWKDGEWHFSLKWVAEEKPAETIPTDQKEIPEIRETYE